MEFLQIDSTQYLFTKIEIFFSNNVLHLVAIRQLYPLRIKIYLIDVIKELFI